MQWSLLLAVALLSGYQATTNVEDSVARWVGLWNTYDLDQVDELFLLDERVT